MLPVQLAEKPVDEIFRRVRRTLGFQLRVDLERKKINSDDGLDLSFEVNEFRRYCLLNGLDDIGLTLKQEDKIRQYEARRSGASIG